jgi:hypothetical protein
MIISNNERIDVPRTRRTDVTAYRDEFLRHRGIPWLYILRATTCRDIRAANRSNLMFIFKINLSQILRSTTSEINLMDLLQSVL